MSATPHAAHGGGAAERRRALVVAVVIASALATSPKMDFWSARRSTVVAPAPVMLATTAAAPAARASQRAPDPAPETVLREQVRPSSRGGSARWRQMPRRLPCARVVPPTGVLTGASPDRVPIYCHIGAVAAPQTAKLCRDC